MNGINIVRGLSKFPGKVIVIGVVFITWLGSSCSANTTSANQSFLGPIPYLSRADSPFDLTIPDFYLEDFEDGQLNTPGGHGKFGFCL